MTLSEETQNSIRKMLLDRASIRQISEELGVSKSTVQKYKKQMPQLVQDFEEDENVEEKLTKAEQKFAKKIEKERYLYEDEIEGWTYHITKQDARLKTSGLWWSGIVYPESAPPDWIEKLKATGMRIAISPLHDKDTWSHDSPKVVCANGEIIEAGARYKAGDRKKEHYHFIGISDQRMSYQDANNLIRNITHGPYIQKCRSLKNAYDYFLHINAPEKYQGYIKEDIQRLNNFHIEPNKYEKGIMQDEILQTIKAKNFTNMDEVVEYYLGQPEYIALLAAKPALVTSYVNSLWKKANPQGRIQHVKII